MTGRIQNEDIKSEAELIAAGADKTRLPNDTKLYVTQYGINQRLDEAIRDMKIGAGDVPLRLYASTTPDAKLNFKSNILQIIDGTSKTSSPIDALLNVFPASSIDFQTGAIVGGTFKYQGVSLVLPAGTVGQFRRFVFALQADGSISVNYGSEQATVGALEDFGALVDSLGGNPIGFIDLECTNVSGQYKTAGSATNIIENKVGGVSRIFWLGAGGGGGGGGDSSLKLQAIALNVATLKKGFLRFDDKIIGIEADLAFDLMTEVNSLGITSPANDTRYHLYLDMTFLPAASTHSTLDYPYYEITSGTDSMLVVLAQSPQDGVDLTRYVPLADLLTNGSGDYTGKGDSPRKIHHSPSVNVVPLVQTIGPNLIGSVGSADNYVAHLKDADSYPSVLNSSSLSLYALAADPNDSIGSRNLTNNGTIVFTGTDIMGQANMAAVLNGTTQSFSSTDTFFNTGDTVDFTADIWMAANDWTSGPSQLMSKGFSASDRGWGFELQPTGEFQFYVPATASTISQKVIPNPGFVDGTWHHFTVRYVAATDTWTFFIDGIPMDTIVQANLVSTGNIFRIGARYNTPEEFFAGKVCQFGYAQRALSDLEIQKLASARIDIAAGVSAERQIWHGDYISAGGLRTQLENWILDKKDTKLYVNLGSTAADSFELRLYDGNAGATTVPIRGLNKFYVSDPFVGGELDHGINSMPTDVRLLYDEEGNGQYKDIATDVEVKFDNTKLYADLSSYTIDSTHRLRVVASVGVAAIGAEYPIPDQTVASGTLLAGQTDINVGKPFRVDRYSNTQHGEVLLVIDGLIVKRNVGNATADPAADGNYEEVDNGTGQGTILRMNSVSGSDREWSVISNGMAFATPTSSIDARLQTLAGQIDLMVPVLADVSGNPTTAFQGASNDADLLAFGGRVTDLEEENKSNVRTSEGAGTTTLTAADKRNQSFDLTANRTVVLPSTGIVVGEKFRFDNHTTNNSVLSVQSSNLSVLTMANSCNSHGEIRRGHIVLMALQNAPTTPAHWRVTECNEEGEYTPTVTNQANLTSISAQVSFYSRIMNKVSVVLSFTATPSAAVVNDADATLPVVSNVTSIAHLTGVVTSVGDPGNGSSTTAYGVGYCWALVAGKAYIRCTQPSAGGSRSFIANLQYLLR
jgi:hypothetical protein